MYYSIYVHHINCKKKYFIWNQQKLHLVLPFLNALHIATSTPPLLQTLFQLPVQPHEGYFQHFPYHALVPNLDDHEMLCWSKPFFDTVTCRLLWCEIHMAAQLSEPTLLSSRLLTEIERQT